MVTVSFRPSGAEVQVAEGTSLHAAVLRAGLPIASACGSDGLCARCGVEVVHGSEQLSLETDDERLAKQRNRIEDTLRLACRAHVAGDVTVTATYW